jgi:hypothetical protein
MGYLVQTYTLCILGEKSVMPVTSTKRETAPPSGFDELDRVKLKKDILVEGRTLGSDLTGTVVLCHGSKAYEVEFDGIHDVFGIPADYLDKI